MPLKGTARRVMQLVSVAALLFVSLVVTASPSSAGGFCVPPACSMTANNSQYWALAAQNWCGDAEWVLLPGPGVPCGGNTIRYLDPGDATPWNVDWDTFRIDDGCKYYWEVQSIFPWKGVVYWEWDLRGAGIHGWFRVHDDELAIITWQDCAFLDAETGGKPSAGSAVGGNASAPEPVVVGRAPNSKPVDKTSAR